MYSPRPITAAPQYTPRQKRFNADDRENPRRAPDSSFLVRHPYTVGMVATTGMTVAQYLSLPETKPYLEYRDGEVCPKPAAGSEHGLIAGLVTAALHALWLRQRGLFGPEALVHFHGPATDQYLLPDVAYWRPDKPHGDEDDVLPPTLAVEVRSAGQPLEELVARCRFYRAHGVDLCWLIDPETRVALVFDGEDDGHVPAGDVLESALLPGLTLSLAELWAALD